MHKIVPFAEFFFNPIFLFTLLWFFLWLSCHYDPSTPKNVIRAFPKLLKWLLGHMCSCCFVGGITWPPRLFLQLRFYRLGIIFVGLWCTLCKAVLCFQQHSSAIRPGWSPYGLQLWKIFSRKYITSCLLLYPLANATCCLPLPAAVCLVDGFRDFSATAPQSYQLC